MAGEIAKAYVQIVPSAEGIKSKLNEQLGGEASSAGEHFGKKLVGKIKGVIATAGIGKAIAAAINEGGTLQQSLGGVETMFGEHADIVIANANKAYKTAGLSANAYMEQVTSFSASLLQSLAGDTAAAADIADMTLRDMSDNANKFGTDMESIQNAYQGFAKSNYTMLDNLKLGYGGTKSEMERLLADAQKISGVKYDINHLDDVFEAIHVIQQEMGVTGTTAKEAAETISGSFAAMKGAFSNVLGSLALGEDIGPSLDALYEATRIFLIDNLLPMVGNILNGIPGIVASLGGSIANEFLGVFGTDLQTVAAELEAKFEPARIALEGLVGTISAIVAPIVDKFLEYVDSGAAMEDATAGINTVLDTLSITLTAVLSGAEDFIAWISAGSTGADLFAAALTAVATALIVWKGIGAITAGIQTLTAVVAAAKVGIAAFGATLAANPIGLVVTAVAALAAGFIYLWNTNEGFREGVLAIWSAIKDGITTACSAIADGFNGFMEGVRQIGEGASQIWSNITSAADFGLDALTSTTQEKLNNVKSAYEENGGGIRGIVAAGMTAIQEAHTFGLDFIDNLTGGKLSSIAEKFRSGLETARSYVSSIMENIKGAISDKIEQARQKVSDIIDRISGIFNFSWSLPHLNLPHISVSGGVAPYGIGGKGSLPKFDIEWYKEGGILQGAQIFGALGGKFLGGGEAGMEAVLPLTQFYNKLESILSKRNENASGGGIHQELHFHGPKNPSPSETARKTKNATKELILALQRG